MIDYFINNKEWLFSGIGVLVISTIITLVFKKKPFQSLTQTSGSNSTNIQASGNINIETIHTYIAADKNKIPEQKTQKENVERQLIEVKIKEGDFIDIPWSPNPYRISLKNIVSDEFNLKYFRSVNIGAELYINRGGGLVYGGEYAKESGVNQWIIPLNASSEEEPYSIYSHFVYKGSLSFFRCYISYINSHSREVTLNIYIVSVPNTHKIDEA